MSGPSIKPLPVDPAVLARIRPMVATDVAVVARLHHAAMGASVWARLGRRFLEAVYAALLTHRDFRGYVYHEEGRVRGFIAGSCNGPRMFRQIAFQHAPTLALATLAGVARNPRVLWQLAQSARYFAQSGVSGVDGIVAESLFCSFEPDLRGRRVSGLINKVLFDELAALGHRFVKITTDADNALSARQLTSWGFSRMGTFRFYGKEMLAWRLDLTTSPRVAPVHRFGTAGLTGGQR